MESVLLIEPVPIDDDLCAGLALIEDLGCCVRLVMYSQQTIYETGDHVHVVKRKIVIPVDVIVPVLEMTIRYVAQHFGRALGSRLLWLVTTYHRDT